MNIGHSVLIVFAVFGCTVYECISPVAFYHASLADIEVG